jgi:hypothetical protein
LQNTGFVIHTIYLSPRKYVFALPSTSFHILVQISSRRTSQGRGSKQETRRGNGELKLREINKNKK